MKKLCIPVIIIAITTLTSFTTHKNDGVVNYYGISESLNFNNMPYNLSWSSHPNDTYYKQEYIPKGNSADEYKDMLLLDFIITDMPVENAVDVQVKTIKDRKKFDMVCNYQVIKNEKTGDYILDFIMSERKGEKITLVEWDAYHYKPYTDKQGHKGVVLFGVSHRAYGDDSMSFLKSLKGYRNSTMEAFSKYDIPQIQIK